MKKPIPKYDYEHKLEPELIRFIGRIEDVEAQHKLLASKLHMKSLEWDSNVSEFTRNINFYKNQLKEANERIQMLKENFIINVREFRTKSNQEDLNKLERKIDDLNFEGLISREEFIRLLKSSF